jgi:hypothetical protein
MKYLQRNKKTPKLYKFPFHYLQLSQIFIIWNLSGSVFEQMLWEIRDSNYYV